MTVLCGCQGEIASVPNGSGPVAGSGGAGAGTGGPIRPPEESGYGGEAGGQFDTPAPAPRVARLTHTQWQNSVRDLLRLSADVELPSDFRPDPNLSGFLFTNNAAALSVDDSLWTAYQRGASEVATVVFESPAKLSQILPAGAATGEARARAFIEEFGRRAHRRPLTDDQVEEYLALYRNGVGAFTGMGDFESGIRLVVEGMLQSPHFLYRIETSATPSGSVIPLDGYEIASRLSYMLWDTMPDDTLFEAAEAGELSGADAVAAMATRMLADPRAERVIIRFHEQLLDLERYSTIAPARAFYPDAPDDLADLARTENELFVKNVLYEADGSYRDLLTSTRTFVNADLAALYGLSTAGRDDTFEPVTLDGATRSGFLTQVGFLASHSTSANPDPIHRGVFIARRISCLPLAAPPANIPPLPPAGGRTNRETIEQHTQQPGSVCATCHESIINPFGFAFENYDSTGAFRTEDNGHPIDATSSPLVDRVPTPVDGAVELTQLLAGSEEVHECYARHWLEFSYGRARHAADNALLTRLAALSAEENVSVKELIVGLVKTESFLTRSLEEVQ